MSAFNKPPDAITLKRLVQVIPIIDLPILGFYADNPKISLIYLIYVVREMLFLRLD